ncbi:MAG: phosphoribosylamine--glycine ligase [Bacteroidetes bacterium]|nr:phosphoribosylamine--glycine ligase [Bacteroidota bacterium]
MEKFTVLLIGSGGREHALAWKIKQSKRLEKLFIAPGNAGTAECGENSAINTHDFPVVKDFVLANGVNMVVVGPEEPLVRGISDFFREDELLKNIAVIGPSKEGANLEGSKKFAKEFMVKYGIPTASYKSFTMDNIEDGFRFLETLTPPYVLKADGLAAGKGVVIHDHMEHAKRELQEIVLGNKFGDAGKKVVIEQFLRGIELSVFVVTDGRSFRTLPSAKDYKRVGENDTGPNTGGMGAISPVPFADAEFMHRVENEIIRPTIKGIILEGFHYCGFIFFGLINVDGSPYVIEYNCRMGDPEAEVVIPRIKNDILDIFEALARQDLQGLRLETDTRAAATVMAVSKGYPGSYEKGKVISGIENVNGSIVFHAGTKQENGSVVTAGGRVLAVTSLAENIKDALADSYENLSRINFDGIYYRRDIGFDVMKYLQPAAI